MFLTSGGIWHPHLFPSGSGMNVTVCVVEKEKVNWVQNFRRRTWLKFCPFETLFMVIKKSTDYKNMKGETEDLIKIRCSQNIPLALLSVCVSLPSGNQLVDNIYKVWSYLVLLLCFGRSWSSRSYDFLWSSLHLADLLFSQTARGSCVSLTKPMTKHYFSLPDTPVSKAAAWETQISVHRGEPLCVVSVPRQPPNYSHVLFFRCLQRDILFWCAVLALSFLTLPTSIAARSQASLFSELDRLGAELDSEIQGLERKLSQKKQRRGRGEVLSASSWLSVLKHRLVRQHPHPSPFSLPSIVQPPHTASRLSPLTFVVQPWNDVPALHQMESLCRHLPASRFACQMN